MTRKFLFVFVLAFALAGCSGAPQPSTEITLVATDFAYNPVSITVPVGQPVTLSLRNNGAVEHDFVIEHIGVTDVEASDSGPAAHHQMDQAEYDLHFFARAGETETLRFTALELGTYQVFCSIEGHKEAGMIGELVVVPASE
ncbi:MAG: cupredoxin domain-containing protein [Anaerolineae bacterium]|nr:cupredoxin domain-containing protein [Anaerolineae bacterium]